MPTTINRMYATKEQAEKALRELKSWDAFSEAKLFTAAAGQTSADALAVAMKDSFILSYHAKVFADRVAKGSSLVSVHAPFGTAVLATSILDSHSPTDSGVPDPTYPVYIWNDATPFSSALRLPTLSSVRLPFESISAIPSVARSAPRMTAWLMPLISKARSPFSSSFGLPTLTRSRTPFSSMFGLPTIARKARA